MELTNIKHCILIIFVTCVVVLTPVAVSVLASTDTYLARESKNEKEGHLDDESTLLFLTSFILADLYIDHNGPNEAKQILEQQAEAYTTFERKLLYKYLMGHLKEKDVNSTTTFTHKVKSAGVANIMFNILADLPRQSQGKTLEQLKKLSIEVSGPPCEVALQTGSHEIMKYLRFRALQKDSPEKREVQMESVQQRMEYAKMLASKLVEIQREKKAFPISLGEIKSLPKKLAQNYLYRGGSIKRPDVPMAMEHIEKPTNGVIVIYTDGHYVLIRDLKTIKDTKSSLLGR